MPNFGDPLTGLNLDRDLTKEELIRAVRFMVAAEYEAVEMYGKVHDACTDEKIKKAIMSIIEEEKIHAGEFIKMLEYLDPKEMEFYQKGFKETEENLKLSRVIHALDSIASSLEKKYPQMALAVDKISDSIETRIEKTK